MITEQKTREQLARLFCLPFAPTDAQMISVTVQEFQRQLAPCRDDEQLQHVIDRIMDEFKRFPSPADLRSAVGEQKRAEYQKNQVL